MKILDSILDRQASGIAERDQRLKEHQMIEYQASEYFKSMRTQKK